MSWIQQQHGYASSIDSRVRPDAAGGPEERSCRPAGDVQNLGDLARVLRALRRRHARITGASELTYREVAAATGWSHGIVGEYLSGRVLPPTDRFDVLVRLFGATPAEQGSLATARDRIEEARRRTPGVVVPRQLPIDVFAFTGRTTDLETLTTLVEARRSAAVISAVAGTAGVGKTALAVRWAHQVADRFPDGQLYIDLRGYGPEPPVAPGDALAGFLRALGVEAADIPAELAERSARFRTAVADRRLFVLLDNAFGTEQVRPLLPGAPGCFVVVTSRDAMPGLVVRDGAHRIDLDVLPPADAFALLRSIIGPRVDADPGAAYELAERCARLPLALRIAGELATARPGLSLAGLVAELRDDRRLDLLDVADDPRTAIRSVFSWSYHHLSPASARTFRFLGLHPGTTIDGYATAALVSADEPTARASLADLQRAHLVSPMSTLHDLLRSYAVELVPAEADRCAGRTRLFDYYVAAATAAVRLVHPHENVGTSAFAGEMPEFGGPDAAMRWLDGERPNLVAVAKYAAEHGWPRHAVDLSRVLWRYLEVGGHYQEALAIHTSAVEAAPPGHYGHATALVNLGTIHWWLGNHGEARDYLERSLAAADPDGKALAAARLGLVYERLGRYQDAIDQMENALAIHRRNGDRHGQGVQLINLGTILRRLGALADAADYDRQGARLFADLGERRLEGYALGNLGAVCSLLGRHDEALGHLERALAYCRETGDRGGEGSALATIGLVHTRLADYDRALDFLRRALDISRETGDRSLETETLNSMGETHLARSVPADALVDYRAALAITDHTGDLLEHARALDGVAASLEATGATAEARGPRDQACALYSQLGISKVRR
jgi:tetratricopeptide (TPR) repeat protein